MQTAILRLLFTVRCCLDPMQDPVAQCAVAAEERLLDAGPDVVSSSGERGPRGLASGSTGGGVCESESACSCSGSCSGSCADSGRAPSEDDDVRKNPDRKNPASSPAAARSCLHRPLLSKTSGDPPGDVPVCR